MTKLLSVKETIWHFYECLEAEDFENASAYFETLLHHYKARGKQIKKLLGNSKDKEKGETLL